MKNLSLVNRKNICFHILNGFIVVTLVFGFISCKSKPEEIEELPPVVEVIETEEKVVNPWDLLNDTDKLIYSISAPFFYTNDLCLTTFDGSFDAVSMEDEELRNKANGELIEKSKKLLKSTAYLDSKEKIKNYALKLTSEGNNGEYYTLQHLYELDGDKNFNPTQKKKLQYALANKDNFGKNPLKAWDIARFITCLRWGVGGNFFSEDEARKYIIPILEDVKERYTSWDDFMVSFLRGAEFYDLKNDSFPKNSTKQKETVEKLRSVIPTASVKFD